MLGKIFSHYKILEKLGEGGMGVVYKAEDIKLKRSVALKFLPPDLTSDIEAIQRFIYEAQTASALDHQNICTIHEIDQTMPGPGEQGDGQMFIAMAYYEGDTLQKKIAQGLLSVEEAVNITIQIAHGLVKAHEKGIIHRDIKPANIIVQRDGTVKIIDFGLSKLAGVQNITKSGSTMGTVAYMSGEQALGEKIDHRSDIWSLGVVLYEMLTGQQPFRAKYDQTIIYFIMNEEPTPVTDLRPELPVELEKIVEKILQKEPGKRYKNMDELLDDLKTVPAGMDSVAVRLRKVSLVKPGRKRLVLRSVFITLIVTLVAIGYFYLASEKASAPVSIAVVGFENMTGDSSYDNLRKVLPNLFITSLERSPYLQVATWERLKDILKQTGKEDVDIIDKDIGFELCRRAGIDNIVTGSFTMAEDLFVTDVKVLDVETKELIKSVSSKGIGLASILDIQIDEISAEIAKSVGLSEQIEGTVQKKIIDVTTTSIEAYKDYIRGSDEMVKLNWPEARQFFVKAIEIDSTFAMAHNNLGYVLGRMGRGLTEGRKAREKAMMYAGKATEKEKLLIQATYAYKIERNMDKWGDILKQMAKKYPNDKEAFNELGAYYGYRNGTGLVNKAIDALNRALELDPNYEDALHRLGYEYLFMREYEIALRYFKRYEAVVPDGADPVDCLGETYYRMGRLDEAIKKYEEALKIDYDLGNPLLWYCYALKENYAEAMSWIDKQMPVVQNLGYFWKGFYYAWLGNLDLSFNNSSKIEAYYGKHQNVSLLKGWIYYDRSKWNLSRKYFENAYKILNKKYPNLAVVHTAFYNFQIGLVDLAQGSVQSARTRLAEIKKTLPKLYGITKNSVEYRHQYLSVKAALAEEKTKEAITILKNGISESVTDAEFVRQLRYNTPFMKDLLAEAYYQDGNLEGAIDEYERLINFDPNSKDRYLIHPKYHYRLGKLYEEKGVYTKALARYEKFLRLWQDADMDLPELIDGKSRYKLLKSLIEK